MLLTVLAVLLVAYLIGSIPFGWLIVKLATGRDIRGIESGQSDPSGRQTGSLLHGTILCLGNGVVSPAWPSAQGSQARAFRQERS